MEPITPDSIPNITLTPREVKKFYQRALVRGFVAGIITSSLLAAYKELRAYREESRENTLP